MRRRKRGSGRGVQSCRSRGTTRRDATRGLFASLSVDIAQLKSTSAVTRGHDHLRRKRDGPNGEVNRRGFPHVCPKPIRPISSVHPTAPLPLYRLFELIVSRSLLLLSNSILHSAAAHRSGRRPVELTRNPVFVFHIARNAISIKSRICVPHHVYKKFIPLL